MPIRRPRPRLRTAAALRSAEALEVRVLPTVTATLSRGVLTLQGDQTANSIKIEQGAEGLVITGETGTLIRWNSQEATSHEIVGVESVRGTFGKGADSIRIEDGVILKNVTLNLGAGANDVEFLGASYGLVSVTGGNSGDRVEFDGAILNDLTLNLVNGNDDVEFRGSTINGAVLINTSNGIDNVRVDMGTGGVATTFTGPVTIKTGNQADHIELRDVSFANLTLDAGADQDEIELEAVTITGRLNLNGGSGADGISLSEVIQTGTGLNSIRGLSGKDVVLINGATFASAVSIDMGSGPVNELELDDVEFQATVSIFSNGPNDRLRIEQDEAATGRTDFLAALAIQMDPGSTIDLGIDHDSSYTQSFAAVIVKGTKPNLLINIFEENVNFTQLPLLKNAQFVIVTTP